MTSTPLKISVVWHWNKKLITNGNTTTLAVEDTLIDALRCLSKTHEVTIYGISDIQSSHTIHTDHQIRFQFFPSLDALKKQLTHQSQDVIFLNHHSAPYDSLLTDVLSTGARTIIYYSSPVDLTLPDLFKYKYHNGWNAKPVSHLNQNIDFHIVHHDFQKRVLMNILDLDLDRVFVAPKSAKPSLYFPIHTEKKWDVIYPGRCTEHYWKRPELAIKATEKNHMTLFMPGAKLLKQYPHVTVPTEWFDATKLNTAYNQSKVLLITSNYIEMGPRVIPEAMMCNIPVVCCSDSPACVSHVKRVGGFIAKPNVEDIASKLQLASRAICNTREELLRIDDPNRIYTTLQNILENITSLKDNL